MKKLLLASLITSASFAATADVVTFNDSSFNGTPGSEVVFDFIDFDSDLAQVTQTDTDFSGDITGTEDFSELGSTDIVNFKLGGALLGVDAAYEVFYNYAFSGTVTNTGTGTKKGPPCSSYVPRASGYGGGGGTWESPSLPKGKMKVVLVVLVVCWHSGKLPTSSSTV